MTKKQENYGKLLEAKKYFINKLMTKPKIAGNKIIVKGEAYTYEEAIKHFSIPTAETEIQQTQTEGEGSMNYSMTDNLETSTPTQVKITKNAQKILQPLNRQTT